MKYKSMAYSSASGTIGGVVYSHNRSGLYTRAWRKPTNPRSPAQTLVRNSLGTLSSRWQTLAGAQQEVFNVYAANTPRTNALGDAITLTGINWYVAMNTLRIQAGLDIIDDGPGTFGMDSFTPIEFTITAGGTTVSTAFTNTDSWANEDGGGLMVFGSRPVGPSINFYAGPFQYAGVILGAAMTAPTSPATIALPFTSGIAGTKQFFRAVSLRADGRFSPTFRAFSAA